VGLEFCDQIYISNLSSFLIAAVVLWLADESIDVRRKKSVVSAVLSRLQGRVRERDVQHLTTNKASLFALLVGKLLPL